jgi:hypothetical protein
MTEGAKREAREFKRRQVIEGLKVSFRAMRGSWWVWSRQGRGHWVRSVCDGELRPGFFFASRSSTVLHRVALQRDGGERQKRSFHRAQYARGYARTTGRRDGLGAGERICDAYKSKIRTPKKTEAYRTGVHISVWSKLALNPTPPSSFYSRFPLALLPRR